jgi:Fic family protein
MPGRRVTRTWHHNPQIHAPPKYRRACKYEAFIPDLLAHLEIQLDAASLGMVSHAENQIRDLNEGAPAGLRPFARLLLRTESIASSKVEGMQIGIRELARAEARKESGGNPGSTAQEILANIDAMELAVEEAATVRRFSLEEIISIHRRLMAKSPAPKNAGRVRTGQNWIGGNDHNPCGAEYVPPPPEDVQRLLRDLCAAVNDDVLPPVVQAALVHAQFETIHPFDDGNGRTGRALVQIVLRRRGIAAAHVPPISVVLAKSKKRYIQGLTQFRGDEGVAVWIEQFADAAATAAHIAQTYLVAVQALVDDWRRKLTKSANPRADSVAWKLIEILTAHPMITAPVAEAATRRTRPAIYKAIDELQTARVLIPLSTGKRNQSWEAAGLLDLLAHFEAGQSPQ